MNRSLFSRLSLIGLMIILIAGCSIPLKSKQQKVQTYRLTPQVNVSITQPPKPAIHLYIPPIEVAPGLDSKKIIVMKSSYEQDFIADSQWPDELSTYLNSVITDALSASTGFATVSNRLIDNNDTYKVLLKVSDFQAELLQNPVNATQVVVSMEVFVLHSKTQKLLMHQRYQVKGKQVEVRVSTIVKALNGALGHLLELLVRDLSAKLR